MKTITLYGIWCDEGYPVNWVAGDWHSLGSLFQGLCGGLRDLPPGTIGLALLPDNQIAYTSKAMAERVRKDACDSQMRDHEHVAPIARLTLLPPPKGKGKK